MRTLLTSPVRTDGSSPSQLSPAPLLLKLRGSSFAHGFLPPPSPEAVCQSLSCGPHSRAGSTENEQCCPEVIECDKNVKWACCLPNSLCRRDCQFLHVCLSTPFSPARVLCTTSVLRQGGSEGPRHCPVLGQHPLCLASISRLRCRGVKSTS